MAAFIKAPMSLRIYAVLTIGSAVVGAIIVGGQGWLRVAFAVAFCVVVCDGNRPVWWLLVALNALLFVAAPFLFEEWWISLALTAAGLACLLAPESRQYVFRQGG